MERLTRSASDQLTLHLSKQTTDPELARLFRSFEAVAQHMGIAFSTTHEVVDIMKEHRVLPHERFALRRMMAGTLTSDPARWGVVCDLPGQSGRGDGGGASLDARAGRDAAQRADAEEG